MTDLALLSAITSRGEGPATPAGIQPVRLLYRRRLFYFFAVSATLAGLGYELFVALGLNGVSWPLAETAIFVLAMPALPWFVTGLWNALIGLWLLRWRLDGLYEAAPFWRAADDFHPLRSRVAVIMTIRNEDPQRAFARLAAVRDSLAASGETKVFDYFVLSDTSDAAVAAMEESLFDTWRNSGTATNIVYRRRQTNAGFKAGNIRDFIGQWGESYDLMLPLDADSVMSGEAIVRLVRVMEAYPKLGILQSLTVGTPAKSAFPRLFQFGMRHAMRSYTMGSAWWTGDCGPYWGHNALIRIAPFRDHCELPDLPRKPPFGGPILSHDQIEAALMRRAGYEVRVVPIEDGSYEDNPPAFLEFAKRDVRWCQGNMQYWRFLAWPRLKFLSRIQIALAILMYLGSAAMTASIGLALALAAAGSPKIANPNELTIFLVSIFLMNQAPKLAGLADAAMSKDTAARYGGLPRLAAGAAVEIIFTWTLSVIVALRSTVFMASLILGRTITWGGQVRDAHGVSWRAAALSLWPETLTAIAIFGALKMSAPATSPWAIPIVAALGLSIPFAVWTASPWLGRTLARMKVCSIPEEFEPVEILERLSGSAIGVSSEKLRPSAGSEGAPPWRRSHAFQSFYGVVRSIAIYHRRPHISAMVRFYRPLVGPGDLVFDIGAHAGDRTRAFLRLGCRVVAVEPQPALVLVLKLMQAQKWNLDVVVAALSDSPDPLKLRVNSKNPTVSTASSDFIRAAQAGAPGWHGQTWDREIEVRATTLDALIAQYGSPKFVKIDVEGFEDRVLGGLSAPLPMLSFEFTTHQKGVALRALNRIERLGSYRFNACLGESWVNVFDQPTSGSAIAKWLTDLPAEANSGDIYCFRVAENAEMRG